MELDIVKRRHEMENIIASIDIETTGLVPIATI